MKTATGLTVIAIGAILAFAVTTSPGFLNVQVVGWILIATGALGIALMPRNQDWLRRRVIIRRTPSARPSRPSRPRRRNSPQLSAAAPSAQPGGPVQASGPVAASGIQEPATRPVPRTDAGGVDDETIEEEYVEP